MPRALAALALLAVVATLAFGSAPAPRTETVARVDATLADASDDPSAPLHPAVRRVCDALTLPLSRNQDPEDVAAVVRETLLRAFGSGVEETPMKPLYKARWDEEEGWILMCCEGSTFYVALEELVRVDAWIERVLP